MPPFLTEVTQLVLNGIMAGTILAVPAIGLTAIYAVLRFPNFALASHATVGAFAGYIANVQLGLPIVKSTASHHFKVLREAGVVLAIDQGTRRYYTIRRDDLDARFPGLLDSVLVGG